MLGSPDPVLEGFKAVGPLSARDPQELEMGTEVEGGIVQGRSDGPPPLAGGEHNIGRVENREPVAHIHILTPDDAHHLSCILDDDGEGVGQLGEGLGRGDVVEAWCVGVVQAEGGHVVGVNRDMGPIEARPVSRGAAQ